MIKRLVLLVRRPDDDQAAVRAWDGTADENKVIVIVDLDDVKVADGALGVAVLPGGFVSLLGPAAAAVAGVGADGACGAIYLFGAVGGG